MSEAKNQRGHDAWRALIEEQQAGQETIVAFCRERGLTTQSFHYHKHKMREETEEGFRELGLSVSSRVWVLFGGVRVEVERGFDAKCLREVVQALR